MQALRHRAPFALAASAAVCFAAWLAFPLPESLRIGLLDFAWVAMCAAAAWCLVRAARNPADRLQRRSFLFLAGGCAAWGAGQLTWSYYEVVAGTEPFPSAADIGFLASVPLFVTGVLFWPKAPEPRTWQTWTAPAVAAVLAAFAAFELLVDPLTGSLSTFADWLALAYPVLDLILLAALVLVFALSGIQERARLAVLGGAVVMLLTADALFQVDTGWGGTAAEMSNLAFTAAFALFGLVAIVPPGVYAQRAARLTEPLVGVVLPALIGSVMVKEFLEDRRYNEFEAWDSFLFGLAIVALVWLSWKAATVLLHAREALARASELQRATMDASRTGHCVFTVDGGAAFWNRAFVEIIGVESGFASWADLVRNLQAMSAENSCTIVAAPGHTARCWTRTGRFVEIRFEEIATGEILVVVDDLTDREREAATRARFVAEVVGAQEAEARRIAGLLHDDAVQQLTALALRLELASMKSGDDTLDALATQANGVTSSLRRLLVQLHPAVLESQGLGAAIEVAAAVLRDAGVQVRVDRYDERHPIETEQLAYRVVQEAFANTLKHARASRVDVRLALDRGSLDCSVSDDGDGFDVRTLASAVARGHLGLHLVHERIELAGGRVEVTSTPGDGTTVHFGVPALAAVAYEGAAA